MTGHTSEITGHVRVKYAAYRWIGGGVPVNYHTVADFRVEHGEILDGILTVSVANLLAAPTHGSED